MSEIIDFNVFIGSQTGFLKGVNLKNQCVIAKNFGSGSIKGRGSEIVSLVWSNNDEEEVIVGEKCQKLLGFDAAYNCFSWCKSYKLGDGPLVSAFKKQEFFIIGLESGEIGIVQGSNSFNINTLPKRNNSDKNIKKSTLCCVKANELQSSEIASGGCENNLAIWDIQNPTTEVFRARNISNNMLDLQVPIWISDLTYLPHSHLIAAATRHKHVRLFDPKAQRKPVINFEWESNPLISLTSVPFSEKQIVVGTDHGRMALFDLRKAASKTAVHVYKGFAGAVKSIVVHESLPLIFSVSLDRFLRIHDLNKSELLRKEFLKSRLTSILLRKNSKFEDVIYKEPIKEKEKSFKQKIKKIKINE